MIDRTKVLLQLGERIRTLREEYRYQQKEIAEKLGVSPQAFSNYENGKREPDLLTVLRLAKLFNVSVDYLLGLTPLKNRESIDLKDEHLQLIYEIKENEELTELIKVCKELPTGAVRFLWKVAKGLKELLNQINL
jgi:transcriptional regulator with XRE-family HTH domain